MVRQPEKDKPIQPQVVEVEVNLSLINDKLNFIIGQLKALSTPAVDLEQD